MQFAPTLQTKLAAEAQAKYERELMLHAADVEALQELKKKVGLEGAQKRELEEKVNKTCSLLQEKTAAWSTLEKHLKVGQPAQRCREQKPNVSIYTTLCALEQSRSSLGRRSLLKFEYLGFQFSFGVSEPSFDPLRKPENSPNLLSKSKKMNKTYFV